ncbi:hypothetical protein [Oceanimonas baumannii]|uniref:hypothetical protein n=1 Tax=Oceanimonas baumannii TaxID=129578 RepID=UPI003A95DC2B
MAVVGGLSLSGVWPRLAQSAEQALLLNLDTLLAAPKEQVVPLFRSGEADVLLIHGGHHTFKLQADGYAAPLRVWAYNEHVFVGPEDDPASLRQATDALDAMTRIQHSHHPFLAFRDPGSHEIVQRLWRKLGINADPGWVKPDTTHYPQQVLQRAAQLNAYVVVGHIPVAFGKLPLQQQRILYAGDPDMRRPYVVLTPGKHHPATPERRMNAERLADYLVSGAGQAALKRANQPAGHTWIYPARTNLTNAGALPQ